MKLDQFLGWLQTCQPCIVYENLVDEGLQQKSGGIVGRFDMKLSLSASRKVTWDVEISERYHGELSILLHEDPHFLVTHFTATDTGGKFTRRLFCLMFVTLSCFRTGCARLGWVGCGVCGGGSLAV